jgi:hypothetical protein
VFKILPKTLSGLLDAAQTLESRKVLCLSGAKQPPKHHRFLTQEEHSKEQEDAQVNT